jgi:hypothetical protein
VTYLPNLLPGDLYSTYAAASYPFACILAAWLVITAWRTWRRRALAVATSVALSCAVGAAATWQYLPTIVSWSRLGLHQLADISEYIKTSTPAAGRLVTFETTLAANTGRKVVPGAAMSYFSYFPTLTTNAARRYHVLNPTLLSEALSNARTEPVLLTDFDLHVTRCLSATLRAEPAAFSQSDLDTLLPELAGRYTLGRIIDDYGPWHNHLYILKPVQIRETRAGLP